MNVRIGGATATLAVVAVVVACEPWDPDPRTQTFPLKGSHVDVACEGCHPYDPPFTTQVQRCSGLGTVSPLDPAAACPDCQQCLDCHECDRPTTGNETVVTACGPVTASIGADGTHQGGRSCGEGGCHQLLLPCWAQDAGGGTGASCGEGDGCHGLGTRPDAAPSGDAHTPHLDGTTLSTVALACDDCHGPGSSAGPAGHESDGLTHVFEALTSDAGYPLPPGTYDAPTQTCANTYCHALSENEPGDDPAWTDGTAATACDACHGYPPYYPADPTEHPDNADCSTCHSYDIANFDAYKDFHLDGTCYGC